MWRTILQVVGLIAAILSLIPLIGADYWWIRVYDFLHMYFTAFTLIAIIIYFFKFKPGWAKDYLYIGILCACFAFQVYRAVDYLPFYPEEVKTSSEGEVENITFYTANVLQKNDKGAKLFEEIKSMQPDLIVFTETDSKWQSKISSTLGSDYQYKVEEPLDNTYGMILYSKLELINPQVKHQVDPEIPSIHTKLKTKKGATIQVYAIHPTPPMPQHNPKSTDRDQELMKTAIHSYKSNIPVIIIGDFNDVPWSDSTQLTKTIGRLKDARIGRGAYNTFNANNFFMKWPLDHILSTSDFRYVDGGTGVGYGSDHYPLWMTLSLESDKKSEQEVPEPTEEDWKQARKQLKSAGMESFVELPAALKNLGN